MSAYDKIPSLSKTVVAIGKFDGVHIGHKELLKSASAYANEAGFICVSLIIDSNTSKKLLTYEERERIIKSNGVDCCALQNLTPEFMSLSAESFVDEILVKKLNCACVVVGYNFRFAKGRSASADDLKRICGERSIRCKIVPKVTCDTTDGLITASSTNIRLFLEKGDVKNASHILGRYHSITGRVVHGKEIGRTINFPTANIEACENIFIPQNGVYSARVLIDGSYYSALTNIGDNPTVNNNGNITIETNILDFEDNIYNKNIKVEFIDRIRDEKKFNSLEELKEQIKKDIEFVLLTK